MTSRTFVRIVCPAALFLVPAAILLGAAGCQSSKVVIDTPAAVAVVKSEPTYVGSDACKECHLREFADHSRTNHATTLRLASDSSLGSLAPPSGPIPGGEYTVNRVGGQLLFGAAESPESAKPMTLAFGSGKTGMTYAGQFDSERLYEYGMSYLPHVRKWYTTPGQEGRVDGGTGLEHVKGMARRCVLCHAVTSSPTSLAPASRFLGVGCESCHGAGSEHIAVARAGTRELKMQDLGKLDAAGVNALCGRCHRDRSDVSMVSRDAASTQRYQPYGLSISPCFRKSNGKLTCLTCHDPHKNAETDLRHYEAVCRTCHNGAARDSVVCPVNRVDKCVGCHMLKRKAFPGGDVPVEMTDHLIWAYRKPTKPTGSLPLR